MAVGVGPPGLVQQQQQQQGGDVSGAARRSSRKEGRRAAQAAKVDAREAAEAAHYWSEVARASRERGGGPRQTEAALFASQGSAGINFDQYDRIPVERSDAAAPVAPPIDDQGGFGALSAQWPPFLTANISRMRYDRPTPIQKHAVPLAASGSDLMCCAQTGSGKTAAFLLPVVVRISSSVPAPGRPGLRPGTALPRALVLAPTRELASQISLEAEKLTFGSELGCCCVYGGAKASGQLSALARGRCAVLVATPGRLTDFLGRALVSLSAVEFLVLDEADRMLDMGFEPQIRRIVQRADLPPREAGRVTLMFSATFPPPIQALAAAFLRPGYVWVGVGRVGSSVDSIEQRLVLVPGSAPSKKDKLQLLLAALGSPPGRTLVFAAKKATASWLVKALAREDPPVPARDIHGDRSQAQREAALAAFRRGDVGVLVATDVAARGLDIAEVSHVVNFDLPASADDFDSYVHRIGRTGRAGHKGVATSLYVPGFQPKVGNGPVAGRLAAMLKDAGTELPGWFASLPELSRGGGGAQGGGGGGGGGRAAPVFKDSRAPQQRQQQGRPTSAAGGGRGGASQPRSHGHQEQQTPQEPQQQQRQRGQGPEQPQQQQQPLEPQKKQQRGRGPKQTHQQQQQQQQPQEPQKQQQGRGPKQPQQQQQQQQQLQEPQKQQQGRGPNQPQQQQQQQQPQEPQKQQQQPQEPQKQQQGRGPKQPQQQQQQQPQEPQKQQQGRGPNQPQEPQKQQQGRGPKQPQQKQQQQPQEPKNQQRGRDRQRGQGGRPSSAAANPSAGGAAAGPPGLMMQSSPMEQVRPETAHPAPQQQRQRQQRPSSRGKAAPHQDASAVKPKPQQEPQTAVVLEVSRPASARGGRRGRGGLEGRAATVPTQINGPL